MRESGIYIRVGKNNVLLEDLDPIERIEWFNGLEKDGLIRTVNLLCSVIEDFKVNYQNSILEKRKYKIVIDKAIEILKLCKSKCAKETIDILKEVE